MNGYDILALIAPRMAGRLLTWRENYDFIRERYNKRRYAAAQHTRLTKNWQATNGSADAELIWDLLTLRSRSHDLVANNPYAASVVRNMVAYLVGTGIKPRAQHTNKAFAKKAQKAWDREAKRQNLYQKQMLSVRSMMEGGDIAAVWYEEDKVPDSRVDILEGEFIDHSQTQDLGKGAKRVMGVEFDANGKKVAYAIHARHPGDVLGGFLATQGNVSTLGGSNVMRVPAEYVDHMFETLRPGQTRGVPWFAPSALKLREINDLADSIRTKKRVESCLAVFRSPGIDDDTTPVGDKKAREAGRPQEESLRPGMIVTGSPGETLNVVNPSSTGDSDVFYRNEMMSVCAGLGIPYHLGTGDVSQANYTSLRADVVAFYMRLDQWQALTIVPCLCEPWFNRIMRREYLLTGDKRYLEVTALHTPPSRPWVDPYKDGLAEIMLARAGYKDFAQGCAERGLDWREQIEQLKEINDAIDAAGLALDIDARRVNGAGALQPPTGYLGKPAPDQVSGN